MEGSEISSVSGSEISKGMACALRRSLRRGELDARTKTGSCVSITLMNAGT